MGRSSRRGAVSKSGALTVCGLGIDRPNDVTLETIQALKDCETAFYIHGDGERLKPFLKTFCSDVRLFEGGKYDALTDTQRREIVAAEVCAELKKGKKVAYVTYGHPLVFSDGFDVMELCRASGYSCRVLTAPSAVDSILGSIGDMIAAFSDGFVVCKAEAAMRKTSVLKAEFPLILLCLDGVVGRGLYGEFCDRIEAAFPHEHRLFAVKCRDSYSETQQLTGRVSDLRGWEKKIVHMMSLVVPILGWEP